MKDNLLWLATGIAGAVLGAVGGWFAAKKYYADKYEKWANGEIERISDEYDKKREEFEESSCIMENPLTKEQLEQRAKDAIQRYETSAKYNVAMPHVISYEQFDELDDDWEKTELFYYADNVLAYEYDDELIEEEAYEGLVGYDWTDYFADEDCDVVYVQNDDMMTAYEICRSAKYYYIDVMPDANKRKRRVNNDPDGT
jgi:hypothetical protein